MPVVLRPPWVKISQRGGSPSPDTRLASMATTMHWAPNFSAASLDELPVLHGGGVDRHLVGAGVEQASDVLDGAHAAADRERHEAALGRALDDVEDVVAVLVARRDVEEAQLVGAGRVIGGSGFDRIAGVDEVDEVDALDDAAVLHVEAGNDAGLQGHGPLCRALRPSSQ